MSNTSKAGRVLNSDQVYLGKTDHYVSESDTVQEIFENERYEVKTKQWSPSNLISSDPKRFQSAHGQSDTFPTLPLPPHFEVVGDWEIDNSLPHSDQGWLYSVNFMELDLHHIMERSERTIVRRRRWIRRIEGSDPPMEDRLEQLTRSSTNSSYHVGTESPISRSPAAESLLTRSNLINNAPGSLSMPKSSESNTVISDIVVDEEVMEYDMEYEEESNKDTESICGDGPMTASAYAAFISQTAAAAPAVVPPPAPALTASASAPPKKRNSFFSIFSSSSSSSSSAPAPAPQAYPGSASASSASAAAAASNSSASNTTSNAAPAYVSDPALRVQSTTLSALGKQIKFLEGESKKADDSRRKSWKDNEKPRLEKQIGALEKKISALKPRLEKEAQQGSENVAQLDEELRKLTEEMDMLKRALYFPFSPIRLGQGGVYLALNDFWLESASGGYIVDIGVERATPMIKIQLLGTGNNTEAGVTARLRMEGFKLVGDKGTGVPRLAFDNLTITVAFAVNIRVSYDAKKTKWLLPKSDFSLKIISFKGPYGLNRSIISIVLSLLTPTIRGQLVSFIPYELGLLVKTLPCPLLVRGQFHLQGVELSLLSAEFIKSPTLAKMCRYSQQQMEMFYWCQKALDRSPTMKTPLDFIAYLRSHQSQTSSWKQLVHLWEQAMAMYCEKVQYIIPTARAISFENFIVICEELLRKRISLHSKLQHVEAQISLNHLCSFLFQIVERVIAETIQKKNNTELQRIRLMSLAERIRDNYQYALEILRMVSKNLDFAQLGLTTSMHAGSDGYVEMVISEILAQAPLLLKFNFSKEKNLGSLPLVPYILSVKPQANGDVVVEIYHFTHDSSAAEGVLPDAIEARSLSTAQVGGESLKVDSSSGEAPASLLATSASYASQNIRTGLYSTHYNRVVTTLTTRKTAGSTADEPPASATDESAASTPDTGLVLRNAPSAAGMAAGGGSGLRKKDTDKGVFASQDHLFVREEERMKLLEEILTDHPIGRQADTVLAVTTSSPHISIIVDKATTLKPGAELFTLLLGPQKDDWTPFGNPNMFVEDEERTKAATQESDLAIPEYERSMHDHPTLENKSKPGCPIMVQTSPGIKLLAQIPTVRVNIALPSLVRFFLAHFADLQLLKAYLESLFGGDFYEEQLVFIKVLVEKIAKYLLIPGLDMDVNLNGKIVTLNGEIMVRIDTPTDDNLAGGISPTSPSPSEGNANCAIELKAQISLKQLLEDGMEIEAYFSKSGPPPSAGPALTAANVSAISSSGTC